MPELDRIAPTRRPDGKPIGYQRWTDLLFLHWEVPAEAMRALLPEPLELDTFDGRAYVGLVPFAMRDVRPRWAPKALAFNFLETNVRTYVIHKGEPGVYFLSLEAASRIAVGVARARWKLPYFRAQMSMSSADDGTVTYTSKRLQGEEAPALHVRYRVGEPLPPSAPGSLEFWFLERYLLFTVRGSTLLRGQVYHTPYPAHSAEVLELDDGLVSAAGLPPATYPADFTHFAPGVTVDIFPLAPVSS